MYLPYIREIYVFTIKVNKKWPDKEKNCPALIGSHIKNKSQIALLL